MTPRKRKSDTKTATIIIRVPAGLRKDLKKEARRRALDMSAYARMLIKLGLDKDTKER